MILFSLERAVIMNIDIVGRIRPAVRGEGTSSLDVDGSRVSDRVGGNSFRYMSIILTSCDLYLPIFFMVAPNT